MIKKRPSGEVIAHIKKYELPIYEVIHILEVYFLYQYLAMQGTLLYNIVNIAFKIHH